MKRLPPIWILFLFALVLTVLGYYLTGISQQGAIERLDSEQAEVQEKIEAVEKLRTEAKMLAALTEEGRKKWQVRYRLTPAKLETADVVEYLERLTLDFEAFRSALVEVTENDHLNYYTFAVSGTAYYDQLYQFIWDLENNRPFYRIEELRIAQEQVVRNNQTTGVQDRKKMLNVAFTLKAYFTKDDRLDEAAEVDLPLLLAMMPTETATHNTFYPHYSADHSALAEGGTPRGVDVHSATLVSIVGNQAVFEDGNGLHFLEEGDAIFLGHIIKVDPAKAIVLAQLEKEQGVEVVDIEMAMETERFRQAQGATQLIPIRQ